MCSYHEGLDQPEVIASLDLYNQQKLSTKQTVYDTDRSHVKLYCAKIQLTHSLLFWKSSWFPSSGWISVCFMKLASKLHDESQLDLN